jgi:hypothetical protein
MSQKSKRKKRKRLVNVNVVEVSLVDSPAVPDAKFLIAKRDEEAAEDKAVAEVADKTEELEVEEQQPEVVKVDDQTAVGVEAADSSVATAEKVSVAEIELVEKASDAWLKAVKLLRGTASELDHTGLEMLANIMRYVSFRYGEDETVRNELAKMDIEADEFDEDKEEDLLKAMKVLGPSGFAAIESAAATCIESANSILGITKSAKEIKKNEGGDMDDEAAETIDKTAEDEEEEKQPAEKADQPAEAEATEQQQPDWLAEAGDILKEQDRQREADAMQQVLAGLDRIAGRLDEVEHRQSSFAEGLKLATGKVS